MSKLYKNEVIKFITKFNITDTRICDIVTNILPIYLSSSVKSNNKFIHVYKDQLTRYLDTVINSYAHEDEIYDNKILFELIIQTYVKIITYSYLNVNLYSMCPHIELLCYRYFSKKTNEFTITLLSEICNDCKITKKWFILTKILEIYLHCCDYVNINLFSMIIKSLHYSSDKYVIDFINTNSTKFEKSCDYTFIESYFKLNLSINFITNCFEQHNKKYIKLTNLCLTHAITNNNLELVKFAINNGCKLDHSHLKTACENLNIDIIEFILNNKIQPTELCYNAIIKKKIKNYLNNNITIAYTHAINLLRSYGYTITTNDIINVLKNNLFINNLEYYDIDYNTELINLYYDKIHYQYNINLCINLCIDIYTMDYIEFFLKNKYVSKYDFDKIENMITDFNLKPSKDYLELYCSSLLKYQPVPIFQKMDHIIYCIENYDCDLSEEILNKIISKNYLLTQDNVDNIYDKYYSKQDDKSFNTETKHDECNKIKSLKIEQIINLDKIIPNDFDYTDKIYCDDLKYLKKN